jgi:hypothetical protein
MILSNNEVSYGNPICPSCRYEQTVKGCETPGCELSIWMTADILVQRRKESEEAAERAKFNAIRNRCYAGEKGE